MSQPDHIQQQYQFAAHIRSPQECPAPDHIEDRRLAVYRDLFFNNIKGFLDGTFPVCAELLGERRWTSIARDFFAHHHSETPYFLSIPEEFLRYLENTFQPQTADPDYLYELAHYEWLELYVDVAEVENPSDFHANLDLAEHIPVLAAAAQGFVYQYPVHKISAEHPDPEKEQTALIVYRDRNDDVRFIETNVITIQLLALCLQQELKGKMLVEQLLLSQGLELTEAAVSGGLSILDNWQQQGLILGGRPA